MRTSLRNPAFVGSINKRATTAEITIPPQVTAWAADVAANNGGTPPTNQTLTAVAAFYNGLVTDGLDTKMYCVLPVIPDSLNAALVPLINDGGSSPWTNNGFVSGDLSVNGLTGDGSSSLNTGFVASTKLGSNAVPFGLTVYISINPGGTTECEMAAFQDSYNATSLYNSLSDFGYTDAVIWDCYGYTGGGRTSGNRAHNYVGYTSANFVSNVDGLGVKDRGIFSGNSSTGHVTTATNLNGLTNFPPNIPIYVMAANHWLGIIQYSTKTLSFAAIHKGLNITDSANFYTRIQALRVALGGGYV